jgi:hypothetical protein
VRTRTADLYRVKVTRLGITMTYKTAGTAKVRGSRTRHHTLWVGVWVGNNHGGLAFLYPLYSTNELFTLWICATKSKFLDISAPVSPTAHRHKLFSNATVAGGGTMRVRYQRGYLRLGQRKKGPDRWEFLW